MEPTSYKEAMDSLDRDKWAQAMMEEHQTIIEAGTWEVHDAKNLPSGRKAIGSRWVYKVKLNKDGSIG